jgi:hypothetical protein
MRQSTDFALAAQRVSIPAILQYVTAAIDTARKSPMITYPASLMLKLVMKSQGPPWRLSLSERTLAISIVPMNRATAMESPVMIRF